MGGSSGTSAAVNTGAVNANNQSQAGLQSYAGAGGNSQVQDILAQYAAGKGGGLQGALSALGGVHQGAGSPGSQQAQTSGNGGLTAQQQGGLDSLKGFGGVDTQGLTNQFKQDNAAQGLNPTDTSGQFRQGAIDQLYSSPETGGLVAQSQVQSNPLYAGLFGKGGTMDQAENNMQTQTGNAATAMGNYNTNTANLGQDRNALSGRDPSYGLQASDLAAYGQASNAIGRNAGQQNQGIAQSLAARGLGSSNNGAAIGSYAGAYGNQAEQLAGLQQQIAQQRIQTAQGLAQARNQSDLAQQSTNAGLANSQGQLANQSGALANSIGNTGMNAYNSQYANNMQGVQNDYNQQAGAAGAALNNQTGTQNLNNSQFSQQQATKTPDFGTQLGQGLMGGLTGGLASGVSGGISKGLSAAL